MAAPPSKAARTAIASSRRSGTVLKSILIVIGMIAIGILVWRRLQAQEDGS
jgi:hypothetical protein